VRIAATLLAALVPLAWSVPPAVATFPGHPGRIAYFDLFGHHGSEIYSIAPDGSGKRLLTPTRSASSLSPAWSPDGTKLAYVGHANRCAPCIFTVHADGTNRQVLFDPKGKMKFRFLDTPTWSSNASRLAFCALGKRRRFTKIFVVNANGIGLTNISGTANDHDCDPSWSPDGSTIAFDDQAAGTLLTMQPDGSSRTVIAAEGRPFNPSWTADSQEILFSAYSGSRRDVFRIDADGTDLEQLTATPRRWEWQAVASPNGRRIVFVRSQRASLASPDDLWIMRANGLGPHPITRTKALDEFGPSWQAT
jgi:TolB protein